MKGVLCALLLMSLFQTCLSSGTESASPCRPQWTEFRQRCFGFYPVWSTWSTAKSLCSQSGGELVSLHTPEERQFIRQLVSVHTAVWLGGYWTPQNDSWFWSDGSTFRGDVWTNGSTGKVTEETACMEMIPKSGEVNSAPCGELRFYICSSKAKSNIKTSYPTPGIVPGLSLFDIMLDHSSMVMEEILHSSSFLTEMQLGRLSESCLSTFIQQEALYLHRVSSTLEVLIGNVHEKDQDMRSLLLDIQHHYKTQYSTQVLLSSPPQWLLLSLLSFHSVVLDPPVYLLTALSARATLHTFIYGSLLPPGSTSAYGSKISLYQQWREDILKETALAKRYKEVIEKKQNEMDVYKAINIFREHMMNQKGLHKAVDCIEKDDEVEEKENVAPPLVEAQPFLVRNHQSSRRKDQTL